MRAKLTGTDAYLEQWRRADPVPCGDDLEAEATAAAEALEAEYTAERLRELVANGGTRDRLMYAVRLWSVRRAGFWEWFYRHFEWAYVAAGPALKRIGFDRLEAPAAAGRAQR